ncbi:gamma-glutamyltransferase family protein [Hyphomonas johnsonii]|uniref:Gamma-glutamyltransferase n=1 Tax=Hyphomonas johnsonii MHS-2 TaxID=1280950 RepID=A0A059FK22_9PROT|nr:gamma-glutamyltransferase family protein [Hyphomonas johnsonii]KCZ90838.1 gamma-glutamyltransferase [Hyphomonas johnsonii MHS-2]
MMKPILTGAAMLLAVSCASLTPTDAGDDALAPVADTAPPASVETADIAPGPGDRMPAGHPIGVRSAVVAPHAAAATAHPLATQTALDVMKAGGSAMDAAIAANAMLGLVEPTANGIGGDLFAIVWDPTTQQLYGYNGSGRSAMGATLADVQAKADTYMDGKEIPPFGTAPVTVPGTVDAWFALHEKFGRRPINMDLEPAIRYARAGAPVPEVISYYWSFGPKRFEPAFESGMLEEYDNAKKTYFSPMPHEGSLFTNPDLANTLERIALRGRDEFYKGDTAHVMGAYFERIGGPLRYEDFAAHTGEWVEPVCVTYREDTKVCELPPNTQGIAALQMLQMLEKFDLRSMGFGSADSIMAQVEAKRLAFVDRARGYADPAYSDIDADQFLNPAYARLRASAIDLNQANADVNKVPGYLPHAADSAAEQLRIEQFQAKLGETETALAQDGLTQEEQTALERTRAWLDARLAEADAKLKDGDTTYLTVTDSDGMMVSLIQSNYRGMGSGLVADGLGFMFQDRGQLFSLDPAHPNVFAPGKRPFHTIIPAFAFRKDMPGCQARAVPIEQACPFEPWLSFGLMGGGMQPQGHVQVILNLVDFDMGLQEAGDAARWEHTGGCEPTNALDGDACEADIGVVHLESGIPPATRAELEARGHTVECCSANAGGYQAIMRDFDSGAWIAATEMRKDGAADGY